MFRIRLLYVVAWTLTFFTVAAPAEDVRNAYQAAEKLEQAEKPREAFLAYLAIPGAGHAAVRVGRAQPDEYLKLLKEQGAKTPAPQALAVEGDLRLALGDKAAALACYRAAAHALPQDSYLAEAAPRPDQFSSSDMLAEPFANGPGSHRDNWLLRRFLGLEAWDDAAAEMARVWEIHRSRARPYRVIMPVRMEAEAIVTEPKLIRPAGFDSPALQFALDYAFFLRKVKQPEKAVAVIEEPLLAIDMDRNPNTKEFLPIDKADAASSKLPLMAFATRYFPWSAGGVSRKEFVRLAFGVFKDAGQEDALVATLEKKIAAGENRLRRVLARVRFHQGKADEALALELDYIKQADFDPLSAVFRRGVAYEETNRTSDAAAAFEETLKLPYKPPKLPDADEEAVQRSQMSQMMPIHSAPDSAAGQQQFYAGVVARLERLYGAMGKPEKALEVTLQQWEASPEMMADLGAVERARARSAAIGKEADFRDWMKKQAGKTKSPAVRVNLHWLLKDYAECAKAYAEQCKPGEHAALRYDLEAWLQRFRAVGKNEARTFLEEVLKVDPGNARARLDLLDLKERFEGPEVIAALESLLETDASFAFARGKGDYQRTQFRNYFDLAYRLLRLYEGERQAEKLEKLGLRIAAGEKPFADWWKTDLSQYQYRDQNELPEDINSCLSLVVQNADAAMLDKLAGLWKDRPDCPAKRQLARRLARAKPETPVARDIGWQGVREGVRLIAASSNVLALARDADYVYAGTSWGIEVYDLKGRLVTRIPLAEPVEALAAGPRGLWAGTPRGLFKIDRDGWAVSHIWLHGDVPPNDRYSRSFPGSGDYWFDNKVYTLVIDGDDLWIGLHRNIQRLNTRTLQLRAFSYRELQAKYWIGVSQIVPDGEYVWAGNSGLMLRYDRAADTWEKVQFGKRDPGLIGVVDGKVLGNVWLDDALRNRPCLVDRRTLAVTPLLIDSAEPDSDRLMNGPFSYYGKLRGKIVLGVGGPGFVVDDQARRLRPLPQGWTWNDQPLESCLPDGFRGGLLRWNRNELAKPSEGSLGDVLVRNFDYGYESVLASPDGLVVASRRHEPDANRLAPAGHEFWGDAGLWWFFANGAMTRTKDNQTGDSIGGDVVFDIVADPDGKRKWLCTDYGLALLDADDRVVARWTRADGLVANRITSGVALDRRLYFSAGWGDHAGGLVVFDPETSVFTARLASDGLATNKLAKIEPADNRLKLVYAPEYGRGGDYRNRQFPPGWFDPKSNQVESGGPARIFDDSGLPKEAAAKNMPYLGGKLLSQQTIGGKAYLCGIGGVVIVPEGWKSELPEIAVKKIPVVVTVDPEVTLLAEARSQAQGVLSGEGLRKALESKNPFIRAKALAGLLSRIDKLGKDEIQAIASCVHDPHVRPRATAVYLLTRIEGEAATAALKEASADRNGEIRAAAVLALARRGQIPSPSQMEEILMQEGGNFPFGADSSIGVQVGLQAAYEALAGCANADVFRLFLRQPPRWENYDNKTKVFPPLGQSLRKHPEAAVLLLSAYDDERQGTARCDFSMHVFRCAGPEMLPQLYEALQSKDRVVRSNAARACGAIGDRQATAHLIQAIDLESGLSRASIVWALGELKAKEALPQMASLYVDARNDERRRAGSGYRMAQMASQFDSHVEALRDFTTISTEWDELKLSNRPKPIDPQRNEPLLSVRTILEAVAKIGPQSPQEFYRKLAAESDAEVRAEAAGRLAEGEAEDQTRNKPILRNLLADADDNVRMAAAASLLILGEPNIEKPILTWLETPNRWQAGRMVTQLLRVSDGKRLAFAKAAVERIAQENRQDTYAAQQAQELLARMPKE